jgi:hypothetical protein
MPSSVVRGRRGWRGRMLGRLQGSRAPRAKGGVGHGDVRTGLYERTVAIRNGPSSDASDNRVVVRCIRVFHGRRPRTVRRSNTRAGVVGSRVEQALATRAVIDLYKPEALRFATAFHRVNGSQRELTWPRRYTRQIRVSATALWVQPRRARSKLASSGSMKRTPSIKPLLGRSSVKIVSTPLSLAVAQISASRYANR